MIYSAHNFGYSSRSFIIAICLMLFINACSQENDAENTPQSSNKPQAVTVETEQSLAVQESTTEAQVASPSIDSINNDANNSIVQTETVTPEELTQDNSQTDKIKRQLDELKTKLYSDSQENAALRQHMDILIKKIEENQRSITEFEESQTTD